jgi:hypothetical protein
MLPNQDEKNVKLAPNEYINNVTINRGILRLLENDKFLLSLITGTSGDTTFVEYVSVPSHSAAPGKPGQIASDGTYLYVYQENGAGKVWGRIALDFNW